MKNENLLKQWIWLDKEKYPDSQQTVCTSFERENANYLVAEFKKSIKTDKTVEFNEYLLFGGSMQLRFDPAPLQSHSGDFPD